MKMDRSMVLRIFEIAKNRVGIGDSVRLKLVPMKRKIASVSLKTNTIRLNKILISLLGSDVIEYLIIHELIHIKLGTLSHGLDFLREIKKFYSERDIERLENKIVEIVNAYEVMLHS
ncbi:hypothetical protein DRN63_05090 [Nanoarchaeota archaeon]|nr:MAG: hypothetical protein DRN63_05090 [Nanoarchaeota archaeon]